jgi:hypothetical protein
MARYFGTALAINTFQVVLCSNGMIGFGYQSLNNNKNQFPFNSFPLVGVAAGNGGPSSIFKYDPIQNFDVQQTIEGPKGLLDETQLFWVYNGSNYILIDRVVSFCNTVVVPQGFELDRSKPALAGLKTTGTNCMNCVLEPMMVTAKIPDPCRCTCGSHVCRVEIGAVRGIGCIGVRGAIPIKSEGNQTKSYVCTSSCVCFNKILCLQCKYDVNPCNDAFFASATVQNVRVGRLITQTCNGDKIYELTGLIKLLPCC